MSTKKRQLRLGAFLMSSGHHVAAWRHSDARADGGLNFQHFRQIAQTAERGKFDMIFFADGVAVRENLGLPRPVNKFSTVAADREPMAVGSST